MNENLHIKSYQLDELRQLDFSSFELLPISELRIQSYLKNPRALPSDKVLYLAFDGEKLVSFRTILPDKIFTKKGVFRVAILSGAYTHPTYRRTGISSRILAQTFEDWNGQILCSNFSPGSEKLYEKSGKFQLLKRLSGRKFFIKSPLQNIIGKRFPELAFSTPILRIIDLSLNAFSKKKPFKINNFSFQKINAVSGENADFINEFLKEKTGTLRATDEMNWVINHSWISDNPTFKTAQKKYPFTLFKKRVIRQNFSIKQTDKVVGFLILFLKEEQLTIPYFYSKNESADFLKEIANFIHQQVSNLNASTLLIANPKLAEAYQKNGGFMLSKERMQPFLITKSLAKKIGDISDISIFDGDGDHVFSN